MGSRARSLPRPLARPAVGSSPDGRADIGCPSPAPFAPGGSQPPSSAPCLPVSSEGNALVPLKRRYVGLWRLLSGEAAPLRHALFCFPPLKDAHPQRVEPGIPHPRHVRLQIETGRIRDAMPMLGL